MRLWPKPSRLAACCLIAASLSLANRATAQTTSSGALTGVVTDQTNAVVRDAEIEIKDSARGITQSAETNREGEYQFPFLRPGIYTLRVTHPGFQEQRRSVTVQVGTSGTVNITLPVAKASIEIIVSDEAPIIQAETADVSTTMNQKQVSEVPNPGNDLTYIVQTAPGVVMNTDLSNNSHFSILGMPAYSYLLTTDGMSNNGAGNETISGALGLLLGQNQIQEATVVSTGYSGQFGGAAGGNINYLTKSGTNGFHGNAQFYWNGSAFNGNYWFNNAWNVPRPFSIANQWAGSVGGPVKKDKLFFFLDSEGLRLQVSSTTQVSIPSHQFEDATSSNIENDKRFGRASPTYTFYRTIFDLYDSAPLGPGVSAVYNGVPGDSLGCAGFVDPNIPPNDPHGLGKDVPCSVSFIKNRGRPSQDTLTSGRVDWNASPRDRVFLRLEHDSGVSAAYNDPISSMFDQDSPGSWWKGEVVETRSFGPSVATQFLVGVSFYSGGFGMKNLSKSLATFPTSLFFTGLPFSNLGNSGALHNPYRTYDFSGDLVKTWGKHKLGFGANFERNHWDLSIDGWEGAGFLSPQSLLAFYQGGLDPVSPETDFTRLDQEFPFRTLQRTASNHFGLYGQDEWHVRKSLSLTFAIRAEHQSNPVCENRCFARFAGPFELISHDPNQPYNQAIVTNQRQALIGMDRILWSPRFGFAWQPFGVTHNTVFRGGVGFFYDPLSLGLTSWLFSNPPLVNSFSAVNGNLTPGESESLFKDVVASNAAFVNGFSVGETLADFQHEVPNFSRPGLVVPQRRMHAPQYQRWSLELQQALGSATSFSVGYFGHHGIHEFVLNSTVNAWGFGSLPAGRCSDAIPDCAPDPRFGGVTDLATTAVSNYNGLVASFRHRMSRWSQGLLQLNYTYSHAFDELSNGGLPSFTLYAQGPQNPNNLRDAYGPADYDVRHSFNANYVWELPLKTALGGHGPSSLVNGWQVSGTFFAHTGFPYTVVDDSVTRSLATRNYGGQIYAVPVGPRGPQPPCGVGAALTPSGAPQPCLPEELLFQPDGTATVNPSALFVQPGCETDFNHGHLPGPSGPCSGPEVSFAQGRNHFRGLGYFSTDFTIMKSTKIPHWEYSELRIGFQFFNVLNHPNFGLPFNESSTPVLGVIGYMGQSSTTLLGGAQSSTSFLGTNQNGTARMVQLKAELKF